MIPIKINTSTLFDDFDAFSPENSKQLVSFVVQEITAKFANNWQKQASQKLNSSRDQFIRSVVVVNSPNPLVGIVELVGDLPNMIESGSPAFDMKEKMLSGKKAKIGKNGKRFNTVPFTFGNPKALQENFSNILPNPVYRALLNKKQDNPIAGGVSSVLTKADLPSPYDQTQPKEIYVPKSESYEMYTHKSSIYEGLNRQKSNVTGQNSYVSFRRVSDNSDPLSWIHQGIEKYNLSDLALNELNVPFEVGSAIDIYLEKNGFE